MNKLLKAYLGACLILLLWSNFALALNLPYNLVDIYPDGTYLPYNMNDNISDGKGSLSYNQNSLITTTSCAISPLGISADLYAPFDCPTSDTTLTDGQVLDTDAEGVETGSLTVVDTGSGTVKIVGGELELKGGDAFVRIHQTDVVTRLLGKAFFVTNKIVDTNAGAYFGLDIDNTDFFAGTNAPALVTDNTVLYAKEGSSLQVIIVAPNYVTGRSYETLILLGGYNSSSVPFKAGDTSTDFKYGYRAFIKEPTQFPNFTQLGISKVGNDANLYTLLSATESNAIAYDNLLIPTTVLDVDTMFQPQHLDVFTGSAMQDITAPGYNPYVVSGTSPTGVGSPYNSGASTWHIAGGGSGVSNIPTTLNELYLTSETGLTQGIFDIDITFTHTSGVTAGRVFCLDDVDNPQNWLEAYYNAGTSKVELQKFVAGSPTSLINVSKTYSAGATLRGIVDYVVATDDLKIKVYYNGALIGTEQTITEDAIAGNMVHGLLAASPNALLENSVIHNRTDSNWDTEITSATGGAY